MQYMVLIWGSDEAWNSLGRDDHQKLADAHAAVHAATRDTGELLAAAELETDGAHWVRDTDGARTTTEGPFTEGREIVSGYYMFDCVDDARVLEIASMFAEAEFAPIEVRRLGAGSTWVDALAN
jgi:hypothetical protein